MKRKFLIPFVLAGMFLTACDQGVVTVNPPVDETVSNVQLISELSLSVAETKDLVVSYSSTARVTPSWIVDNSEIVSLRADGDTCHVTGVSNGVANVIVTVGKVLSASCVVTVGGGSTPSQVTVNSVTMSESNKAFTYYEGADNTFTLRATVGTSNNSYFPATWTSTNETVARVQATSNNEALVTVLGAGETDIVATAQSKSDRCRLSVTTSGGGEEQPLSVTLDKSSASLEVNGTVELNATVVGANSVTWQSNNPDVASVSDLGMRALVTAKAKGTAQISATVTNQTGSKAAVCTITVTEQGGGQGGGGDQPTYEWSQPGHLYLHYYRDNADYAPWAIWMWANSPIHYEGTLWGASAKYDHKGVTPTSYGWMTKSQCGGSGSDVYSDDNGIICDIDLTRTDLVDGRLGEPAPIVQWEYLSRKTQIGFLIVDQSKMDGTSMWTSDGDAEAYIKNLQNLMPQGVSNYLHVYCRQGSVQTPHYEAGVPTEQNPTISDTTGQYRSKDDETILRKDNYPAGVPTSTTFLDDTPGVGYQIFVPSFKDSDGDGLGDLRGIISELDYLANDLGVKVLWLTPIQESNSYHGYDITDYYKIDEKFGTLQDYAELLYKAHEKGMKVLMDMVINHTSKSNVLFQKSQRAAKGTRKDGTEFSYRDMYLWKYADGTTNDKIREWDGVEATKDNPYGPTNPANFVTKDVNASDDWYKNGESNYYYFGKFGSGMAELNYSCQDTRDYMTDMCKYWLSFGLDGFRLDAIKHIYLMSELDPSLNLGSDYITYDVGYRTYYHTELQQEVRVMNDYTYDRNLNVIFWKQFAGALKSAYPGCFLVGENFDGWNQRIAPFYESMDSQFDFSTYFHLNENTGSGVVAMGDDVQQTMNYNKAYRGDQINGAFTSNHDLFRMVNHAASKTPAVHHVEVTSSNRTEAYNRARWFGAVTLLTPGLSWIYYGDEIGLTGNLQNGEENIDHGNNTDRWYRQPMKWGNTIGKDGVTSYNVAGASLKWDTNNVSLATVAEQKADSNSMLNFFAALTKTKCDPRFPAYGTQFAWYGTEGSGGNTYVYKVSDNKGRTAIVCINAGGESTSYHDGHNAGTLIGCSPNSSSTTLGAYGFAVFTA